VELTNKFAFDSITFDAVSRMGHHWNDDLGVNLTTKPAREMMSRQDYLTIVMTLDTVILPLEKYIYD